MVAVQAAESDVVVTDGVSIAAVNGPDAVVLSGLEEPVLALASRFERSRRLAVSHAFHSALMDPMLDEFGEVVAGLTLNRPAMPLVSCVTGRVETDLFTEPAYWVRHVRETVRFAEAVHAMRGLGVDAFVEVGPDSVLASQIGHDTDLVVPTLRRDRDDETALVTALARLHVAGVGVDWPVLFAGAGARRVPLPTYAFQRERYWPEPAPATPPGPDAEFWAAVDGGDLAALTAWRDRQDEPAWRYRITWRPVTPAATPGRRLVIVPLRRRPLGRRGRRGPRRRRRHRGGAAAGRRPRPGRVRPGRLAARACRGARPGRRHRAALVCDPRRRLGRPFRAEPPTPDRPRSGVSAGSPPWTTRPPGAA
nr:hypothetical protein GCM10020092_031830 [Actinoplanes digitatis]